MEGKVSIPTTRRQQLCHKEVCALTSYLLIGHCMLNMSGLCPVMWYTHTHLFTYLNHFFDIINGTREEAADFFIVVHVVCVAHAHEEYVGR